jgi:hypothetical protein
VQEVILAEEKEHGLDNPNGQDVSTELDKTHAFVDRIDGEHAAEVRWLSQQVVEISIALVDLGKLRI